MARAPIRGLSLLLSADSRVVPITCIGEPVVFAFVASMRRVLTSLVLAFGTFMLLFAGTGAAAAKGSADGLHGTFGVAPSRPGDHLTYTLNLIAMQDTKGGWAYDANARLEVERQGDRVLAVDGQPQLTSSFSSTWTTGELDWWGWATHWGFATAEQWEAYGEAWEDYGEQWDDYSDSWDGCGDDPEGCGSWAGADTPEAPSMPGSLADMMGALAAQQGLVGEPWHVAHVAADGRVVATTTYTDRVPALPGQRLADALGVTAEDTVLTRPGSSTTPCGFRNDLQGAVVPVGDTIHVGGTCPPAGGHFGKVPANLTDDRYRAIGEDVVQGRHAIVYGHEAGEEKMRLWFADDVPYPVRLLVPVVLYEDYETYLLYEMTEFRPGTLQPAQQPPTPSLLPRLVTGPDASDVATGFSLEQAFQAAQADLQDRESTQTVSRTAQFLIDHPDAAMDEASFVHLVDGGAQADEWRFTLIGGSDSLAVTATRGPPDTPADPGLVPGGVPTLPAGVVPAQVEDGVTVHSERGSSAGHVALAQMPAELPRVADVLALWQADGAPGGGTPAWAFRFEADGSTWMAVGVAEATTERSSPNDPGETTVAYRYYGVGPDGGFLFTEESPTRYDVPPQREPGEVSGAYDTEHDKDWSDPGQFSLASIGYWTMPGGRTTATVGAAASIVGMLAYAVLSAKGGALGLFSRIGNEQVLEHPLRQQIADLVTAEPGIHFQELVRRLDAGRGTMEHHLRKLVSANVLTMQVSQGFTCFFPKGKVDRHLMAAAPVLKSDGARQVLQAIQQSPGIPAQDVAASIGLTPSTVNYHLKRLVGSGLVAHERRGRFILLTPTPLGTQALSAWGRT